MIGARLASVPAGLGRRAVDTNAGALVEARLAGIYLGAAVAGTCVAANIFLAAVSIVGDIPGCVTSPGIRRLDGLAGAVDALAVLTVDVDDTLGLILLGRAGRQGEYADQTTNESNQPNRREFHKSLINNRPKEKAL
jgi:hypothetical protein